MLKMIFIIFVSVTASAITTAGLLYRYTVPAEPVRQVAVSAQADQPEYAKARPGPIEILDEYVNLQTELPPANTRKNTIQTPKLLSGSENAVQPQRVFDHKLLMSDIAALSNKLERFNDFLSVEVQRLKGESGKDKP